MPLHFTKLPSSMLPKFHITDFAHYVTEFGELFSALHRLAKNGSAAAGAAIRYAEGRMTIFFVLLGLGVVLGIGTIIFKGVLTITYPANTNISKETVNCR